MTFETRSGAAVARLPDRNLAVLAAGDDAAVGQSATAFTALSWKRNTCSADLRVSDQTIAEVSKLPDTAGRPSAETASARTGPPWPRNCACAGNAVRIRNKAIRDAILAVIIGRLHTQRRDPVLCAAIAQARQKGLHGGPGTPALHEEEIVVLRRERQETEPVHARHRLDGDAPVGARLRHRCGDGVVRARLIGVAGRPRTGDKLIDQHAGAGAGVPVDHQARRIGERRLHRILGGASLETLVAGPEQHALHPLPALHQRDAGREQVLVVFAGCGVDQMHRRDVALAALRRCDTALAADRDGACGKSTLGQRAHHHIERDVVTAHDDDVRSARGIADQA